jgi:putative transposase
MRIAQLKANAINLPSIGLVKMRLSRPIPGNFELRQVQVVKRASGWYLLLSLKPNITIQNPIPHGKAVGIDLGLQNYVATSSKKTIAKPKIFESVRRKLKSLQSKLKHKKMGSRNWQKVQDKIARLYEYRRNVRKDFQFKFAHKICNQFGMVFAEDLSINPMLKGACRNSIREASWGEFLYILEWVCWKRGVYFYKVPPHYTSQTCPKCQLQTGKKKLSERIHRCRGCGYTIDRDVAAAKVILQRGLAAVGYMVKKPDEGKVFGSL